MSSNTQEIDSNRNTNEARAKQSAYKVSPKCATTTKTKKKKQMNSSYRYDFRILFVHISAGGLIECAAILQPSYETPSFHQLESPSISNNTIVLHYIWHCVR